MTNTKKQNVLFVMVQMDMGGSEHLVHSLASKLDRSRFNPSIAWFYGDRVLPAFKELDIPLYHVPKVRRLDLAVMQRLADIIRREHIDVVHAHHFMSMMYSYYGSKVVNNAKLIFTAHSAWEVQQISWYWRLLASHVLGRIDASVGVSEAVTAQMRKEFPISRSRLITIRNGVDVSSYANRADVGEVRKKLGIAKNEKAIGMVANFKEVKNHLFLLKAYNELRKSCTGIKLLLVGQGFGSDRDNTEPLVRNYVREQHLEDSVSFLGYRQDVPDVLRALDVFCLTSNEEGLPISLIEAMAAGLPVVGTNVKGIQDVIRPNMNGFLVEPDDVVGLKDVLAVLVRDEALKRIFGRESQKIAWEAYSLDRCIEQHEELFLPKRERQTEPGSFALEAY